MSGAKPQITWQHMRSVSLPEEQRPATTVFASTPINNRSLRITATVVYAALNCVYCFLQLPLCFY